ncbi:MAG: UDP-N-acetylmuramate dehydrogenase, partial [Saprospiraceae bacterium]|nr:UDP-N-acetylmuramate dehydrogenase [Saprospiraceae bacterium]
MNIRSDVSLLPYNTFGIDARAAHLAEFHNVTELQEALLSPVSPRMVWGGGSNVVLRGDYPGLILLNRIKGITITRTLENHVEVTVGGGEGWHDFVLWAVNHDLGGVENLSLIPGTVGAAPVQNIGAYGVEIKDTFVRLEAVHLETGTLETFNKEQCRFGYRDSFFKHEGKGKYAIVSVTFSLTRHNHHINTGYGDIRKQLDTYSVTNPTITDVSRAVVAIRSSKLPDPAKIGNCGSFFKNPETDRIVLERIRASHPQAPAYDLPDGRVKIPAGWLIEQCGWKGRRIGNVGCYEKQALV